MISVIVPIYNAERYLYRCIESILSQTYTDLELLLIDDGSTDSSGAICDEYAAKDSRIQVFHKANSGVSSARNLGLSAARGEYIMFVDSDDYMLPTMCEVMLSTLNTKNTDLVVCGTTETGGGIWGAHYDHDYSFSELKKKFVEILHTELLSPPWNKLFRRELIGEQQFREDMSFGEDLVFNIQYLKRCKNVSFIKETPFFHEKNNNTSLVVRFNRSRLFDIEKLWLVIDNFSIEKNELFYKYLRDLAVYSRQLFKTDCISWNDKLNILEDWYNISQLRKINLLLYNHIYYSNWLLLLLLKKRQWKLANFLVNVKKGIYPL